MTIAQVPHDVLRFWFEELSTKDWFKKSQELDVRIGQRFGETLDRASVCELFPWRETPRGRLAEILVLDQFSRNIHRDTPKAFAQDALALALSQEAIESGADKELESKERSFLYMPFMHSESLAVHDESIRIFDQPGLEMNLDYAHKHRDIIVRFGRYPHRNAILMRESTAEEIAFLKEPGSSF